MTCPSHANAVCLGNLEEIWPQNQVKLVICVLYVTAYIIRRISLTDIWDHQLGTGKSDWPEISIPCSIHTSLAAEGTWESSLSLEPRQKSPSESRCIGHRRMWEKHTGHQCPSHRRIRHVWVSGPPAGSNALSPPQGLELNQSLNPKLQRTSINRDKTPFGSPLLFLFSPIILCNKSTLKFSQFWPRI